MNIRKNEILRYMGIRPCSGDARIEVMADEITGKVLACVSPRHIYKEMSLEMTDTHIIIGGTENKIPVGDRSVDGCLVCDASGGMTVNSSDLAVNLQGCDRVMMFAATLGAEVDTLIRRYEVTSMSFAATAQAVCAEVIEAYCNEVMEVIRKEQLARGYYLKPRFSPGYGDFELGHQMDFFRMLDISRKLGVTLSSGLLMIPTKSVTAIIGLTRNQVNCSIEKCSKCSKKDCDFRYES